MTQVMLVHVCQIIPFPSLIPKVCYKYVSCQCDWLSNLVVSRSQKNWYRLHWQKQTLVMRSGELSLQFSVRYLASFRDLLCRKPIKNKQVIARIFKVIGNKQILCWPIAHYQLSNSFWLMASQFLNLKQAEKFDMEGWPPKGISSPWIQCFVFTF